MYESKIEELEADAAEYRRQMKHHSLWIARIKTYLAAPMSAQKRIDLEEMLDMQRAMHDGSANNLSVTLAAIEQLKWDEISDLETLSAYGSLTVDMRGEQA